MWNGWIPPPPPPPPSLLPPPPPPTPPYWILGLFFPCSFSPSASFYSLLHGNNKRNGEMSPAGVGRMLWHFYFFCWVRWSAFHSSGIAVSRVLEVVFVDEPRWSFPAIVHYVSSVSGYVTRVTLVTFIAVILVFIDAKWTFESRRLRLYCNCT